MLQGPGPWFVGLIEGENENTKQLFVHSHPLLVEHAIRVEYGYCCVLKIMVGPFQLLENAKSAETEWKKSGSNALLLPSLFLKWQAQQATLCVFMKKNSSKGTLDFSVGFIRKKILNV